MLLITRRAATGLLLVPFAAIRPAEPAATARITFVLVNDIYLMSDQMVFDGERRGGFARLAAVVRAERARGGPLIFAHGGDTLSPSLMSGIDRGAHIITLTNLIPPDIFVPGNHEFDFGKGVFLQRMAEAKFPLYGANLRAADGQPLPGFNDRSIVTVEGVHIGIVGAAFDDSVRASDPGDLRFLSTVATVQAQAQALRREGADLVVAVVHATREQAYEIFRGRSVDLILTGHTHDLFINYDGRTAMVESSYDAHYVTAIDIAMALQEANGTRTVNWWPQFRVIDTATVTPDAEVAAVVAKFEAELSRELDTPIGTTTIELDSRTATVRTREAAIGNIIADALRWSAQTEVAVTNGGTIRGSTIYPAGSTITRRNILTELPFSNRLVTINVSGSDLKAAIENGLSRLPNPSGRFPQVSGLKIEADPSRPLGHRVLSIRVGDTPLDGKKIYSLATNDFMQRGGDGYTSLQAAKPVLAASDAPLTALEVIDYIKDIGALRTGVDGRIVIR
jgi:5'-nucleotidase/UDP-sugar diphosphatase